MEKKVILVTGGNRGIGLSIVKGLAVLGHEVIMGTRNKGKGEEIRSDISKGSENITVLELDVTDKDSIENAAKIVAKKFGRLDVLVNNAGIIGSDSRPLADGDVKEIKEIFKVNYFGPMRMNAAFMPLLRKSKKARIINMSSGMGALDDLVGGYAGYRLSKAGLNAQTIQLSNELKGEGIDVMAMCPGWVRTEMGGKNAPRSVEEGADTAIWLATTSDVITGKFYRNRKVISW